MLVRRFGVVCLLAALFGTGFAVMAAKAGRTPHEWRDGALASCVMSAPTVETCRPYLRRS